MPFVEANGVRMHYEWDGLTSGPTIAFSNSLGTNLQMWNPQVAALGSRYRLLRYDTRGHGRSSVPSGPYSIEQIAADFLALLDVLGVERCYFCGLSMGGMLGLRIAIHNPNRLEKLAVSNTGAKIGTAESWNERIKTVRTRGMAKVASDVVRRWFTPDFLEREPDTVAHMQQMLGATNSDGYAACCEAIRDLDQRKEVAQISVPTLIISGTEDPVTPPREGTMLANAIKGARHEQLRASHLSNVERPHEFTQALISFLEDSNG